MSYPISLVNADDPTDVLTLSNGVTLGAYAVQALSVGGADVRTVVNNRSQTYGTIDTTLFAGAAAVTCALTVLPSLLAHTYVDVLRSWINPSRRSYLTVQRTGWTAPRRMLVRGDALTAPVTVATDNGPMVTLQLAWRAPDGVWEGATEQTRTVFPGGVTANGLILPATFPIDFGYGTPPGISLVTVGGTAATPPKIRIYGPVTGPGITNQTTGQTIQFIPGFVIPAGGYVSIDVAAGTVLANDDPSLSRLNSIDMGVTDFWLLQPGQNEVAFTGSAISPVTETVLSWRERTV